MQNNFSVPFVDLGFQWSQIRTEALSQIDEILCSGAYLDHPKLLELESEISNFLGIKNVVLLNSGTDALLLSLFALGIKPGDEVITTANSYIATVAAIQHVGAIPVFADVGEDHLINPDSILKCISKKTKAILPVHLEGKVCNMIAINKIAVEHGILVIEDAAQSFGSKLNNIYSGKFSAVSCFSLHPLKNLNACGDGGFIATDDSLIAERIRQLANHGQSLRNVSVEFGFVSRFDSIQAAILQIRLKQLKNVITTRRRNAKIYNQILSQNSNLTLPLFDESVYHTYHTYVIEVSKREKIVNDLYDAGIETKIHYPNLISDQIAYKNKNYQKSEIPNTINQSKKVLSLPIGQHLSQEKINYAASTLLNILDKI